jgi:uncharacterized protein (TIGR02246 family)
MTTTGTPSDADQAAVAAIPGRIVAAWAAHDADAFASVFAKDGSMILPGVYQKGRDDIRDFMAAGFSGPYKGTQVTGEPFDVRVLADDVCILLSVGGVLAAGETELPPERVVRASWLVVKQEGEWLLAAYQNSPSEG